MPIGLTENFSDKSSSRGKFLAAIFFVTADVQTYANKNLSGNSAAAPITDKSTDTTVADTETTYINSSEVSAKKNNFTLFLDLGSDLMYEDSSGKGGLFKTSWDLANIATDGNGDTLTSIKAHANSGKLNGNTITISSDGNTNNVYGYYNSSGKRKTLIDKLKFNFKNSSSLAYTDAVKYRVHTSFNFDAVFPVRSDKTTSPKYINGYAVPATDPLYIRIESEELNEADGDKQNTTARQMFININADNTASNARPLIIFYEGPDRGLKEGYDDADVEGSTQTQSPKDAYPNLTRRTAQPVVLNLQADFKGILFAPSSPVIIKGNGHKMEGFVVAKNFIDFADSGDVRVTENGLTFYTDYYGNIQTKSLAADSIRKLNSNEQPLPSEASEFKKKILRDLRSRLQLERVQSQRRFVLQFVQHSRT